jgi:hypothetical protein
MDPRSTAPTPHDPRPSRSEAEGLTPFDEQRAASLADEGGTSGAAVEGRDLQAAEPPPRRGPSRHALLVIAWGLLGLGVVFFLLMRRG